ncbi:MAG TPA: pitrilysin family protein [Candidatus Gastranaerophilaceae bacterium]|nr:pitrilysin family protein [Candidatus Gastranaerophilaceae bacterium]
MNIKKTLVKYPFLTKEVEIYELENNHKIVLAHKEGGLVNVSSWIKTGSINENDQNNGISHFLEHLMFKGTNKYKAGEFDKILEAKGGIVNAATWKDYTFYYVTLPKGEKDKDLYKAIELHADMILDPILPEEEIGPAFDVNDTKVNEKRERHVVIEEIRMRQDQPWTKVYNACNKAMYTSHPYKRDVIGTPEIISQVTRQDIMDYYKTFYSPQNITTIIVGDFDNKEILNKVISEFQDKWGQRGNLKLTSKPDEPVCETKYLEQKSQINSAFMMFGYLGPLACDLKNSIALEIIAIILGEGTSSRLYQNLIEKQKEPVFNMINADNYQFKDGNNFFIQANFIPEKKDLAINLVKSELEKIVNEEVSQREFLKAKKKIKSLFAHNAETVSEIGETIGYYMTVCENLALVEEYLNILEKITPKDLKEAARNYLPVSNAVISILMPE